MEVEQGVHGGCARAKASGSAANGGAGRHTSTAAEKLPDEPIMQEIHCVRRLGCTRRNSKLMKTMRRASSFCGESLSCAWSLIKRMDAFGCEEVQHNGFLLRCQRFIVQGAIDDIKTSNLIFSAECSVVSAPGAPA